MIRFSYENTRDEIVSDLRGELSRWGGFLVGDINNGGFSVLEDNLRIRAAYSFSFAFVYVDIVDKPDYVSLQIIEGALRPFFEKGEFALFASLLEEVSTTEAMLAPT